MSWKNNVILYPEWKLTVNVGCQLRRPPACGDPANLCFQWETKSVDWGGDGKLLPFKFLDGYKMLQ
jgi:hypothetical protein